MLVSTCVRVYSKIRIAMLLLHASSPWFSWSTLIFIYYTVLPVSVYIYLDLFTTKLYMLSAELECQPKARDCSYRSYVMYFNVSDLVLHGPIREREKIKEKVWPHLENMRRPSETSQPE